MPSDSPLPYPFLAVTRTKGTVYHAKANHGHPRGGTSSSKLHSNTTTLPLSLPQPKAGLPLQKYSSFSYFSNGSSQPRHDTSRELLHNHRLPLPLWSADTASNGLPKYGIKGRPSAKRNKGLLKNAENPTDSKFWKERAFLPNQSAIAHPRERPKSHSISSVEKGSKERILNRPRTCKSEVMPTGICRMDSRSSDNRFKVDSSTSYYQDYVEEEESDPDVVSPNHLIDVLESENVTVPTTGCYSVLSDYSHVRATPIKLSLDNSNEVPETRNVREEVKPMSSPSSESIRAKEVPTHKLLKNGKVHFHQPSLERPYISLLETLRDKYAFNINDEEDNNNSAKQVSKKRNITISNIGEVTKLKVKPDSESDSVHKKPKSQPMRQTGSLTVSPPDSPNSRQTSRKFKSRLLHSSQDLSESAVPMLIEIKTMPYNPKSTFYNSLQEDHRKQLNSSSYDVHLEQTFNKDFLQRTIGHVSQLKTTAPNNTPQPSLFDPSDLCGNAY